MFRYKVLMRGVMLPDDPRGSCVQLLHLYDSSVADWQLGKTKVRTHDPVLDPDSPEAAESSSCPGSDDSIAFGHINTETPSLK